MQEQQTIKDINIPVKEIKDGGSTISIAKSGGGNIYSTLITNEFRTDKNAALESSGLQITREYINAKGADYSIGIGDLVEVRLTVSGLEQPENYGIIVDELPSGLIPVNESLRNEDYGSDKSYYYSGYGVTDREATENGMQLSLYRIGGGKQVYTYNARAVSAGTFTAPPARAELMYSPEVYGTSEVAALVISDVSKFEPTQLIKNLPDRILGSYWTYLVIFILIASFVFWLNWKRKKDEKYNSNNFRNPIS